MVGTPVYQVGRASAIHEKNLSASNPGGQHTWPPADSGAKSPAIRPWMWNSGMMQSPRSSAENPSVAQMLPAEATRFRCNSGTILGRDVVPDVCSTSAASSGVAARGFPPPPPPRTAGWSANSRTKLPAPRSGCAVSWQTGMPSFAATSIAGEDLPCATMRSFALRSVR